MRTEKDWLAGITFFWRCIAKFFRFLFLGIFEASGRAVCAQGIKRTDWNIALISRLYFALTKLRELAKTTKIPSIKRHRYILSPFTACFLKNSWKIFFPHFCKKIWKFSINLKINHRKSMKKKLKQFPNLVKSYPWLQKSHHLARLFCEDCSSELIADEKLPIKKSV